MSYPLAKNTMFGIHPLLMPDSVYPGISHKRYREELSGPLKNKLVYNKTCSMKIKAIVERGSDGRYSVYSEQHFGNSYFGGFGESVSKAKEDFQLSIQEAIAEQLKAGCEVPEYDGIKYEFRYDLPSFFNFFDFINVSKFAEYAGINESKMRAYKSGISYPGEKTTARIFKAIRRIGTDLCSSALL